TRRIIHLALVAMICGLIILPSLYMAKMLTEDSFIGASGLKGTRFDNMFSVSKYFAMQGHGKAEPKDFLAYSLNFQKNIWFYYWVFLGVSTLLLSAMGMILMKDSRKYIFFGTLALIFLSNAPHDPRSLFSAAHWIIVLTNPFSFLLRSFHMTNLLMPCFFLPLIALGLQALRDVVRNKPGIAENKKISKAMIFLLITLAAFALLLPSPVRAHSIAIALGFLMIFYLLEERNRGHWIGRWIHFLTAGLVCVILLLDIKGLYTYAQKDPYLTQKVAPRTYSTIEKFGPLILEFQNPRLLPWREYFQISSQRIQPRLYTLQNNPGLFFQFTPLPRVLSESKPGIYEPVPAAYKDLYHDKEIFAYLQQNKKILFIAPHAVSSQAIPFSGILGRGLADRVIIVSPEQKTPPPTLEDSFPARIIPRDTENQVRISESSFAMTDAQKRKTRYGIEYSFRLPKDFPDYLSTTVFTDDHRNWKLTVGPSICVPAQGALVEPFSFDVQNIRTGYLTILLPKNFNASGIQASLKVKIPDNILNIWRNQHDTVGLTYAVPYDGWLVFHYPYDTKWSLTIDGEKEELYRVNKYFIGSPIKKGERKILLQYWPGTPLRGMIIISILLMTGSLGAIMWWGIIDANRNENKSP
ncbi:MAG: YfhO family protein, partial [Candidatus Omnitrophota bacterium]